MRSVSGQRLARVRGRRGTSRGRRADERLVFTPDPISPHGFTRVESGAIAVIGAIDGSRDGSGRFLTDLETVARARPVELLGTVEGGTLSPEIHVRPRRPLPQLIDDLRGYSGVLVHPSLYRSLSEETSQITSLAKSGVPMAGSVSPAVTAVLGDEITELIAKSTVESITDPDDRERLSVRLRRAAWKGAFSSPSMSVVLTTNRPEYLDRSLRQIRAQDYPEFEIVVVTHGWHLDPNLHDTSDLEIVEVPAAVPFGQTLNIGFEQAKGDLVTKVDDDDWYSPSHLSDLACALAYSNTSLVAKSAEFVYLAELDITIRRMVNGSESYNNRNVAGGTFLIRPELLEEVGGWRDEIDRHADQALLNDLSTFGIPWYRTHGFGYVLHRRRSGHTWDAKLDYFLDSSVAQYRGLASGASLLGSE